MSRRSGERKIVARYKLQGDPIHYAGDEITELAFRKPKTGDIRAISADPEDDELGGEAIVVLLARMADVSEEAIEEMDLEDLAGATEAIEPLFAALEKKGSRKRSRSARSSGKRSRRPGATR